MARYLVSQPILAMDTKDLAAFGRAMRTAGADIEAECKEAVWEAAGYVVRRAKENIKRPEGFNEAEVAEESWRRRAPKGGASERIAGSIFATRTRGLQVFVRAGGSNAPFAKAVENHGEGYVRHPVFGRYPMTRAGSHSAYLRPALEVGAIALQKRTEAAVNRGFSRAFERRMSH